MPNPRDPVPGIGPPQGVVAGAGRLVGWARARRLGARHVTVLNALAPTNQVAVADGDYIKLHGAARSTPSCTGLFTQRFVQETREFGSCLLSVPSTAFFVHGLGCGGAGVVPCSLRSAGGHGDRRGFFGGR